MSFVHSSLDTGFNSRTLILSFILVIIIYNTAVNLYNISTMVSCPHKLYQ